MSDKITPEKFLLQEDTAARLASISKNVISRTFMVSPNSTDKRGANAWIDNTRTIRSKIESFREYRQRGDLTGAGFDKNYLEGLGINPESEADLEFLYNLSALNEAIIYQHECNRGENQAVLGSNVSRCMLTFMENCRRNFYLNREGFFEVFDSIFDNEKILGLFIKTDTLSSINGLEGEAYALDYLMELLGKDRPGQMVIPAREDDMENKIDLIRRFERVIEYFQVKAVLSKDPIAWRVKNDGPEDENYEGEMNELRATIIQMGGSFDSLEKFKAMVNRPAKGNTRYDGYVFFAPIREEKFKARRRLKQK